MTTQVTTPRAADCALARGAACLLLALNRAGPAAVVIRPLARLGEDDRGAFVAATVMIDVGEGGLPFPLEVVGLAVAALRDDPPLPGFGDVADRLDLAARQARAQAQRLLSTLH